MTADRWGNPVSYHDAAAVRGLDRAIDKLNAYQADPVAEIDAVLAEHPDFAMGHAFRAGVFAMATDKAFDGEFRRSVAEAERLVRSANARERGHIAAACAWANGDFARATELWGRTAIEFPRDILAIQLAQLGDFFHGYSLSLRDRVARVLPHWSRDVPGYGFVLGMYAFGLEEAGEYARAEAAGREATALNPQDGWAVHAVAHVMEMTGRASDGMRWLRDTADGWAPGSLFGYHNWWHLALFHLEAGERDQALRLYDDKVATSGFNQALELIDGAALLWRLTLLGHDVGTRWADVAARWRHRVQDGHYAFNDLHAMMAFVATGDAAAQDLLLRRLEAVAADRGTNAMMTREVGLPACQGLAAFGRGDHARAIDLLMPLRAYAARFGGSHAQRDVFAWTLIEAAIRGGNRAMVEALLAERTAAKPASPLTRFWVARAGTAKPQAA